MHSEHLANTNESKSLSNIGLVYLKNGVTELLHYQIILHHHVFDNTHDI